MDKIFLITDLPRRLKKFRQDNHLTQPQVAQMLGLTPAIICYWEQGKKIKNIRYLHMIKLIELFDSFSPNTNSPTVPASPPVPSPPCEPSQPCATECQVTTTKG